MAVYEPIVKGTTYEFTFKLKVKGSDTYIDLSGGTVYFTLKTSKDIFKTDVLDTNAVLKKNVTVTSGSSAKITLTPTETKINAGTYVAGITLKTFDGIIITPINYLADITVINDPRQRT